MAYGLAVWSSSGVPRVYSTSWLIRFHSRHTYTVNGVQNIVIPGFNPNTWGFLLEDIGIPYPYNNLMDITLHHGYIQLTGNNVKFTFSIYSG